MPIAWSLPPVQSIAAHYRVSLFALQQFDLIQLDSSNYSLLVCLCRGIDVFGHISKYILQFAFFDCVNVALFCG